jgi:hypothetical protein
MEDLNPIQKLNVLRDMAKKLRASLTVNFKTTNAWLLLLLEAPVVDNHLTKCHTCSKNPSES